MFSPITTHFIAAVSGKEKLLICYLINNGSAENTMDRAHIIKGVREIVYAMIVAIGY